jgi:hypothetical protein
VESIKKKGGGVASGEAPLQDNLGKAAPLQWRRRFQELGADRKRQSEEREEKERGGRGRERWRERGVTI